MTTYERIEQTLVDNSIARLNYRGQGNDPRKLYLQYTRAGYRLLSSITSNRGVRMFTVIPDNAPCEVIREKALSLINRAIERFESEQSSEAKAREARKEWQVNEEQDEQAWRRELRVAFGKDTDEPLNISLLSPSQILRARSNSSLSLSVPLPVDREHRAAFIAKLHAFVLENL